jgi:hypothetical protein
VTVTHHGGSSAEQKTGTFSAVMLPEAIWRFFRKTRTPMYAFAYRAAMFSSALTRLAFLGAASVPISGRHDRTLLASSKQKWAAVLRWSVGRDDVVRRFYTSDRQAPLTR